MRKKNMYYIAVTGIDVMTDISMMTFETFKYTDSLLQFRISQKHITTTHKHITHTQHINTTHKHNRHIHR